MRLSDPRGKRLRILDKGSVCIVLDKFHQKIPISPVGRQNIQIPPPIRLMLGKRIAKHVSVRRRPRKYVNVGNVRQHTPKRLYVKGNVPILIGLPIERSRSMTDLTHQPERRIRRIGQRATVILKAQGHAVLMCHVGAPFGVLNKRLPLVLGDVGAPLGTCPDADIPRAKRPRRLDIFGKVLGPRFWL